MPKKVYRLKRATPKMKIKHMNSVLEFRADLKEKQAEYADEGDCALCEEPMGSRPLFMVGEYDMCYGCFRALEAVGVHPLKRALDLGENADFLRRNDE
jgi:hypothetical protein